MWVGVFLLTVNFFLSSTVPPIGILVKVILRDTDGWYSRGVVRVPSENMSEQRMGYSSKKRKKDGCLLILFIIIKGGALRGEGRAATGDVRLPAPLQQRGTGLGGALVM